VSAEPRRNCLRDTPLFCFLRMEAPSPFTAFYNLGMVDLGFWRPAAVVRRDTGESSMESMLEKAVPCALQAPERGG
jgi:hypothetical protein